MKEFNKRYLFTLILFVSTLCVILFCQSCSNLKQIPKNLAKIPLQIGEWQGKDIAVNDKILDILQTQSLLMREYTNKEGLIIYLTIVYYSSNRVEFHSPERCAVGQGSNIVESGYETIPLDKKTNIVANKFLVKNQQAELITLYYYESGKYLTASYFGLRWYMILNKLQGKPNSGTLVKFSIFVPKNPVETVNTLKKFISEISQLLPGYLI
jgi:EpsI family protein